MGKKTITFLYNKSLDELKILADKKCREVYENKVYIRGLIEFSNYCSEDCQYCGIQKSNHDTIRYRLSENDILDTIKTGKEKGITTYVLQSGEDRYFTDKKLVHLIEKIKAMSNENIAITLSCGEKDYRSLKDLRKAGVDRYLLRFETSNEALYEKLRPGNVLKDRLKVLENLKKLGYEVGSGFMTGLPGETDQDRINNVLLCRDFEFDMIGIGPFIPHPSTALADSCKPDLSLTLRCVSVLRLVLINANLPATTAAGSIDPFGREKMLAHGANVLMPNLTPVKVKKQYLLYPGKICLDESGLECIHCQSSRVKAIGKELVYDRGNAKSWELRNA